MRPLLLTVLLLSLPLIAMAEESTELVEETFSLEALLGILEKEDLLSRSSQSSSLEAEVLTESDFSYQLTQGGCYHGCYSASESAQYCSGNKRFAVLFRHDPGGCKIIDAYCVSLSECDTFAWYCNGFDTGC